MPLTQYNAEEVRAQVALLEPDFVFLMEELDISSVVQANLAARKILKMGVFAKIEPTEEAFRRWIQEDLGFDAAAGLEARVETAKLVEAWDAARQRATTSRKLEAEAKVSGASRELLKGVHLALRRAYVRANGDLDDRKCPGRAYVEARLEQLDDGELEAEPLTKVTTVALELTSTEAGPDSSFGVRRDGLVHVVKGQRKAPMPSTPEQLRDAIRVMARQWSFVQLKGSGRAVLRDYGMDIFEAHLDYLLGDECYRMSEAHPGIRVSPSWDLLLAYEHELRKHATKLINQAGYTLKEALQAARDSTDHRTKYLVTPLALHGTAAGTTTSWNSRPEGNRGSKRESEGAGGGASENEPRKKPKGSGKKPKGNKGDGKGGGKGGGKGKSFSARYKSFRNNAAQHGLEFKTSAGQLRCHRYGAGNCTYPGCAYSHSCAKCGGPHPVVECPQMAGL